MTWHDISFTDFPFLWAFVSPTQLNIAGHCNKFQQIENEVANLVGKEKT